MRLRKFFSVPTLLVAIINYDNYVFIPRSGSVGWASGCHVGGREFDSGRTIGPKCPMWDVKEPTHYLKRVLVVQLGVTYMYEYHTYRGIKLVQRDNWGLRKLFAGDQRNYVYRKYVRNKKYFEFTEVFLNLTLDLNSWQIEVYLSLFWSP